LEIGYICPNSTETVLTTRTKYPYSLHCTNIN